jgi:hypothetical protein
MPFEADTPPTRFAAARADVSEIVYSHGVR